MLAGVSGAVASKSLIALFILIGVGIGLILLAVVFGIVLSCIISPKLSDRRQKAVAKESQKYSTRLPIPCSWRLNITTHIAPGADGPTVYKVVKVSSLVFLIFGGLLGGTVNRKDAQRKRDRKKIVFTSYSYFSYFIS